MNRRYGGARIAALATGLATLGLLAAGCGGGLKSPSVASLGRTTANGASNAAGTSRGFPSAIPGGAGFGASMSMEVGTDGVRYTACMRSHGVPNYPDPDAHGVITITTSPALDPSSPLFQTAQGDCQHLLPPGKAPSPAMRQRMKVRLLAFAACMRSHGVPGYPDPRFGPGGMVSQAFSRSELDPNSPIFQAARKACQSDRTTP